jgi:DNA-binding MarR family transcriptional regulator
MKVATDDFNLQVYLPYLLNRAAIRFADAFCDVVRPYDISIGMWRVLAAVRWQPGIRMGELAQATSIEISTLSRQVSAMERRALLKRGRSRDDARAVEVVLTPEGERMVEEILPRALECQDILVGGLSEDDVQQLYRLLAAVFRNGEELGYRSAVWAAGQALAED